MILALLLAAAAPATAVDAERAFAAAAQRDGQWTAFRAWSTDDALMFVPQPVNAHQFLAKRKDPPQAVRWAPSHSYISCDGAVTVNTGPWTRADKSVGYFTTVWMRQRDGGWKWVFDAGDGLEIPRATPAEVSVRKASCDGDPRPTPVAPVPNAKVGNGTSGDATLTWSWWVMPDGARRLRVNVWDGKRQQPVIIDDVAAPPK